MKSTIDIKERETVALIKSFTTIASKLIDVAIEAKKVKIEEKKIELELKKLDSQKLK